MTLIGSANILMSAVHQRWLTLKECITVQGIPVQCAFTHGVACSSFALRSLKSQQGVDPPTWPSRRAALQQAGNSMHAAVAGLVLLFCFSQICMDPDLLDMQQYRKRRAQTLTSRAQQPNALSPGSSSNSSSPGNIPKRFKLI